MCKKMQRDGKCWEILTFCEAGEGVIGKLLKSDTWNHINKWESGKTTPANNRKREKSEGDDRIGASKEII